MKIYPGTADYIKAAIGLFDRFNADLSALDDLILEVDPAASVAILCGSEVIGWVTIDPDIGEACFKANTAATDFWGS